MATVGLNNFIHAGLVTAHGVDEISTAAALSAYAGGGLIGSFSEVGLRTKHQTITSKQP